MSLKDIGRKTNPSVFSLVEDHLELGVKTLISQFHTGAVVAEFRCKAVEDSVHEIAELKPYTMSWSNVLDYIDRDEFHCIARACSKYGDTLHSGYSMNWVCRVYGASFVDYLMNKNPQAIALRSKIIDEATQDISRTYSILSCSPFFKVPIPQNPINTVDQLLAKSSVRKSWLDWWAQQAESGTGSNRFELIFNKLLGKEESNFCSIYKVYNLHPNQINPSGGQSIYMGWTYDPTITLNIQDYNK